MNERRDPFLDPDTRVSDFRALQLELKKDKPRKDIIEAYQRRIHLANMKFGLEEGDE